MITKYIFLIFFPFLAFAQNEMPREFSTDECTNFIEGTWQSPKLWRHCCVYHDLKYWAGGSKINKNQADLELKECVKQTGAPWVASLMYWGIRAGSKLPIKYPSKKWSNGWPGRPAYQELSFTDIELIEEELEKFQGPLTVADKLEFIHYLYSREN